MATGPAGEQSEWRTKAVPFTGGMRFDLVPVLRDSTAPGSLIDATNFQSGVLGGYQRVKGYSLWDTAAVPGTGRILGVFVFSSGVIACRGANVYYGRGFVGGVYQGWGAAINPTARTNAGQYRYARYRWSTARIVLCDGTNYPMRWDGTTATDLNNAPQGATVACEYHNTLFVAKGSSLYGSAPNDETTWSAGSGGFVLVVGDNITGLRVWRDELYVLCTASIGKLTGTSAANFVYTKVTSDIGCSFPDTVQEVAGNIMFLAPDGVRLISGTARIGDSNLASITNPVQSYINTQEAAYNTQQICSTVVDQRSQYRLFFSKSSDTASPGLLCCLVNTSPSYYSENDTWEFFKLSGFQVSSADHGVLADGITQLVVHGDYSGKIFQHESGNSFNGANISASLQLPYLVFDDPGLRKVIYKLRLYVTVEGNAIANLTAQINIDDNDPTIMQPPAINMTSNFLSTVAVYGFSSGAGTRYGQSYYGQGAASNYLVNPIGGGFDLSITISSNDTLPQYTIRTAIIDYAIEARQ